MNCEMMMHVGDDEPACVCEACFRRVEQERDEARELVLEIGLTLRAFYRDHRDGWAPPEVTAIYRLIDAQPWVKEETSRDA